MKSFGLTLINKLNKSSTNAKTQIHTDTPFNLKDLKTYDQPDMVEVDEELSFDRYERVDENEQKLM
jgi:hypothetical protein